MSYVQPLIVPKLIDGRVPEHIKPVGWELTDSTGISAGAVSKTVRAYRLATNNSTYDLQLSSRIFFPESWDCHKPKQSTAYTITLWGWSYNDGSFHTASVGKSYRWKDGDHINGHDFAVKMSLNHTDANALLQLLAEMHHSVSLCEVTR